jgi:hypothetical protein
LQLQEKIERWSVGQMNSNRVKKMNSKQLSFI